MGDSPPSCKGLGLPSTFSLDWTLVSTNSRLLKLPTFKMRILYVHGCILPTYGLFNSRDPRSTNNIAIELIASLYRSYLFIYLYYVRFSIKHSATVVWFNLLLLLLLLVHVKFNPQRKKNNLRYKLIAVS